MKFSWKIFLCVITITCVTFSLGGFFLISSWFYDSLRREIQFAQEENRMLSTALQTTSSSSSFSFSAEDTPTSMKNTLSSLLAQTNSRNVVVWDTGWNPVYTNLPATPSPAFPNLRQDQSSYWIAAQDDAYQVHCVRPFYYASEVYFLESIRDISPIYETRSHQYQIFFQVTLVVVVCNGIVSFLLSKWLTRPIWKLSRATQQMAQGDYTARAYIRQQDEIGILAGRFNQMAENLENKISELENAIRRQEEFSGSFAHELKTPLTSIMGYADLLRSQELSPETRTLAANYIFQEGKRLESLSMKMLDLIVLKKQEIQFQAIQMRPFLFSLYTFVAPFFLQNQIKMEFHAEDSQISMEPDLMRTLCMNLLNNAQKAIEGAGTISLLGGVLPEGYRITISDTGKGIPQEELAHITEAFYRVDKSRARAQGGVGLGLSICSQIIALHDGSMTFQSQLGQGTTVTILLKKEVLP